MAKKLDIDWPELQFGFDSSFGEVSCYLDRETGTVVTITEDIRAAADDEDDAGGFDPWLLAVRAHRGGGPAGPAGSDSTSGGEWARPPLRPC